MDVFIDMDSTLNNFSEGFANYHNKIYGTNIKIRTKDRIGYEVSECIPGIDRKEALRRRDEIFSTPGFWKDIPIFKDASNTTKWICDNFNTYILTAPWIEYKDCMREKLEWLEEHLPFMSHKKVIFCHDKNMIHEDSLIIDDHITNLMNFKGYSLRVNYPYNKNSLVNWNANNWSQVLVVMKSIKRDLDRNGRITRKG